MKFSTDYQLA